MHSEECLKCLSDQKIAISRTAIQQPLSISYSPAVQITWTPQAMILQDDWHDTMGFCRSCVQIAEFLAVIEPHLTYRLTFQNGPGHICKGTEVFEFKVQDKKRMQKITWGLVSSNWSAPNADTLGLIPPVPSATMYNDAYRMAFWYQLAFWSSYCGVKPGMHALAANKIIPYRHLYNSGQTHDSQIPLLGFLGSVLQLWHHTCCLLNIKLLSNWKILKRSERQNWVNTTLRLQHRRKSWCICDRLIKALRRQSVRKVWTFYWQNFYRKREKSAQNSNAIKSESLLPCKPAVSKLILA